MRSPVGGLAVAVLIVSLGYAAETPRDADALRQPDPHAMFFAGADAWHAGGSLHAGLLWSPGGLFREGPAFKLLTAAGYYRYHRGGRNGTPIHGLMALDSAMAGWRFQGAGFEATVLGGLDVQHHWLLPEDPGNRLRGFHMGFRGEGNVWYQPTDTMMLTASVSASSIGPNYWARAATGWRVFDALWVGPAVTALGDPTYHQARIGLHATSLRTGAFEWSGGLGFSADNERRSGFYGHVGVLLRR